MALTKEQSSSLDALNNKIATGYTPTATDTANLNYAKTQGYQAPTTPTVAPVTTPPVVTPAGSVAINGAEFNTADKQKAGFTNIQPVGNTLYGIPKAPIVPDVIPQSDLTNTMTPGKLAGTTETAKTFVGFNDTQKSDLDKAYQRQVAGTSSETDNKNIEYAKKKGWQPTTPEAPVVPVVPVKSTVDQVFDAYNNMADIKAKAKLEASKTMGLDEKSTAIATAQSVSNQLRTDLQNQGILDIKEQDAIRAKPILTSQIAGQLEGLSREQKLDAMILQNNYNNSLVEVQIAQGNYDRAREIVKETADDAYTAAKDQVDALLFKNEIEDKAADKLTKQLEEERDLAKDGYVLIKDPSQLKGLSEDKIYRDPVNKNIYLKPAPKVATTLEIGGITYGFDDKGNKIANYGYTKKTTGSSSGSSSKSTTSIAKTQMASIEKNLLSQVGGDGYVSPEDYGLAKADWIQAGGSPSDFDTKYSDRRNPKNNAYEVSSKPSTKQEQTDEEILTDYKNNGGNKDEALASGYDQATVDKVFGKETTKKNTWVDTVKGWFNIK